MWRPTDDVLSWLTAKHAARLEIAGGVSHFRKLDLSRSKRDRDTGERTSEIVDVTTVLELLALCSDFARELAVSANEIGDEFTAALSKALKSNSTLETLELRSNQIGAAGAQSLAGMLQANRSLTSLNLTNNQIEAGGAKAIADSLQQS